MVLCVGGRIFSPPAAVCLSSPCPFYPPFPVCLCCLLSSVCLRAGARLKCIGYRTPAPCPAPCDVEHCKLAARGVLSLFSVCLARAVLLNAIKAQSKRNAVCCGCMTAGRGAIEVHWALRPGAGFVSHCQPAEHGLLLSSFLSLLSAFLLNATKRNQT